MNTIREDWNNMARAYEEFNNNKDSYSYNIEWCCIREMLPNIQGKTVLDVGCGTGIFTFLLEKSQPAQVIGLDLSEEMLAIARQKAQAAQSKAVFVQGDATDIVNEVSSIREVHAESVENTKRVENADTCIKNGFDFIFSSTTSHYIEDLDVFFQGIYKVLKDNGEAIVSVIHPVYSAQYPTAKENHIPSDEEWVLRYLDKSKRAYIQPWIEYNDKYENFLSMSYHHTFSDYINAIINSGLTLCDIKEPLPPESWKQGNRNRYEGYIETPIYMLFKLIKTINDLS